MGRDVIVVGGGAIGSSCAYELAARGASVTLLERGPRVAGGASDGNAGLVVPSHAAPIASPSALREGLRSLLDPAGPFSLRPRPAVVPWLLRYVASCTAGRAAAGEEVVRSLSLASLAIHREYAERLGTGLVRRGILTVYESGAGLPRDEETRLDAAGARKLEPALVGPIAAAAYGAEEAHVDPAAFVEAVAAAARELGARIRLGCDVLALRPRTAGGMVVSTTDGDLHAATVVLAAGAWSAPLARTAGVALPIEGGKGYHVELAAAPGDPELPLLFHDCRVAVTPLPGRLRLAGTLELSGLDLSVSRRRVDAVFEAARRNVRGIDRARVRGVWRGLRPCTPDGLPVIGRAPGAEDLVVASGHAMMGIALAPVTGRLVAQVVAGDAPEHDLAPLRPGRFSGR